MRKVSPPSFNVTTTLAACAASIRDVTLSGRLTSIGGALASAESSYIGLAQGAMLYSVTATAGIAGHVTTDEMGRVYKGTFVKSKGTRHMYDAIKKGTKNDICPLCGQRDVSTLDHYLPWTAHPSFAVTPANLVPSCSDCNKAKLTYVATAEADQLIHPYFDDLDHSQWIFARVMSGTPSALLFEAAPPQDWPEIRKRRAVNHFTKLGLGRLYGAHAAEELLNIRHALDRLGAEQAVQLHLTEQWHSRSAVHLNSWSTAAYQAWALSRWFCQGGFRH